MSTRERYEGIQSVFSVAGNEACLFLCLLSIIEDYTNRPVDFIQAYRDCLAKGFIRQDFYVQSGPALLQDFTGKKWTFKSMDVLPDPVPGPMYTVESWYNPRTKLPHFKRRGYDTLNDSVTVKEGYRVCYYTYTVEL